MGGLTELLRNVLRCMYNCQPVPKLDTEGLTEEEAEIAETVKYLADCYADCARLCTAISEGNLGVSLPSKDNLPAAPLKDLHATLKHLTWQAKQVARGDYKQRVVGMGELSDAFNTMIEQLDERQRNLDNEINTIKRKSAALGEINQLMLSIIRYIPQQIVVISRETGNILFQNDLARSEMDRDEGFTRMVFSILDTSKNRSEPVVAYDADGRERYFSVSRYDIEWGGVSAEAILLNDVSNNISRMNELENRAYNDGMTGLYNRFYGMMILSEWLRDKKQFCLIFADLDNLKYINDRHGHPEGDKYIISTAKHFTTYENAVVCRVGGDEFMILVPDTSYDEAERRIYEIYDNIKKDDYLVNKEYYYSVSIGIVCVESNTDYSESDILSIADERMYQDKKAHKRTRAEFEFKGLPR